MLWLKYWIVIYDGLLLKITQGIAPLDAPVIVQEGVTILVWLAGIIIVIVPIEVGNFGVYLIVKDPIPLIAVFVRTNEKKMAEVGVVGMREVGI